MIELEFKFLDDEEKEIVESFENNEWVNISNSEDEEIILKVAQNTQNKTRELRIDITEIDFKIIEQNAAKVGITSNLLIKSIIHDYSQKYIQSNS